MELTVKQIEALSKLIKDPAQAQRIKALTKKYNTIDFAKLLMEHRMELENEEENDAKAFIDASTLPENNTLSNEWWQLRDCATPGCHNKVIGGDTYCTSCRQHNNAPINKLKAADAYGAPNSRITVIEPSGDSIDVSKIAEAISRKPGED